MSRLIKDLVEMWGLPAVNQPAETQGWVLYDAECAYCVSQVTKYQTLLAKRGLRTLPLQTPWVRAQLNLAEPDLMAEMRLLLTDGRHFGGGDAILEICRRIWWAWPLWLLARLPIVRASIRRCYRRVALRRHCTAPSCAVASEQVRQPLTLLDFLPMCLLTVIPLAFRDMIPNWILMWLLAGGITFGWKWVTYRQALLLGANPSWPRRWGYLFLWIGMDADKFFDLKTVPPKPTFLAWIPPLLRIIVGIFLLMAAVPIVLPRYPLTAGWLGMIGFILILHFGVLQVLSLAWRGVGVNATPLMREPLRSVSLSEFWGQRWNTAFNYLAYHFTFRPLSRWSNSTFAGLLVFLLSGLVHELVISIPARGGYGWPTGYFAIQGLGLMAQKSLWARRIGLDRGALGWAFTMMVAGAPVYWLFHPPFIHHVILPMLSKLGEFRKAL